MKNDFLKATGRKNNAECMKMAVNIEQNVNLYFDKVLVNCDKEAIRINRLNMLGEMKSTLFGFIDFDKLVIDRK